VSRSLFWTEKRKGERDIFASQLHKIEALAKVVYSKKKKGHGAGVLKETRLGKILINLLTMKKGICL